MSVKKVEKLSPDDEFKNIRKEFVNKKEYELIKSRSDLVLKATNDSIWDWDLQSNKIFFSRSTYKFLVYKKDDLKNFFKNPDNFVHTDNMTLFKDVIHNYISKKISKPFDMEVQIQKGDKTWGWYNIRGVSLWDSKLKKNVRLTGTLKDITRRHIAEEKLKRERHLFRTLIDNINTQVYFKDKDSKFTLVNKSVAEWVGVNDISEMYGKSDFDYYDPEHAEQSRIDEKIIMKSGKPIINKIEREKWEKKEDSWVQTTKMPLLDSNKNLIGTFGVSSNVSPLVKIQNELKKTADELRQKNQAMAQDLLLAKEIQSSFIPSSFPFFPKNDDPRVSHVEFNYKYIPTDAVGGDFFEVIKISDSKVGVFIGDVMGHGVRSALLVSILKGLIQIDRSIAENPSLLIRELNNRFYKIIYNTKTPVLFVTGFYILLDFEKKKISYTFAGHPKPILINKNNNSIDFLTYKNSDDQNQAIGFFNNVNFPSNEIDLEENTSILLYTDGIYEEFESKNAKTTRGVMIESIKNNINNSSNKILNNIIIDSKRALNIKNFDDDVCMVLIDII